MAFKESTIFRKVLNGIDEENFDEIISNLINLANLSSLYFYAFFETPLDILFSLLPYERDKEFEYLMIVNDIEMTISTIENKRLAGDICCAFLDGLEKEKGGDKFDVFEISSIVCFYDICRVTGRTNFSKYYVPRVLKGYPRIDKKVKETMHYGLLKDVEEYDDNKINDIYECLVNNYLLEPNSDNWYFLTPLGSFIAIIFLHIIFLGQAENDNDEEYKEKDSYDA